MRSSLLKGLRWYGDAARPKYLALVVAVELIGVIGPFPLVVTGELIGVVGPFPLVVTVELIGVVGPFPLVVTISLICILSILRSSSKNKIG